MTRFKYSVALLSTAAIILSFMFLVNVDQAAAELAPCPVSDTVILDGGDCFRVIPAPSDTPCPAGSTLDLSSGSCREPFPEIEETIGEEVACPEGFAVNPELAGICSRTDPAQVSDPVCPLGSRGTAGACYVVSRQYECPSGMLTGDICSTFLGFALNGPSSLPGVCDREVRWIGVFHHRA